MKACLSYPDGYDIPRKNVFVLSCIDLRLTDNLVDFLHYDNLQNRYDHFALAGASLLCCDEHQNLLKPDIVQAYAGWKTAMLQHLDIAIQLHHIKDVYIVEHQHCGAYEHFIDPNQPAPKDEIALHSLFAHSLADDLRRSDTYAELHIHCFFIDLRGNVRRL